MHGRGVPTWRGVGAGVLVAAVPWSWFVVRDALGVVTDVLAIIVPLLAVVVVGAGLVGRRWRPAWALAASSLVAGTVAVLGPWLPADEGAVAGSGVTVAGANVDGHVDANRTLLDLAADVLVVPEVSADGVEELDAAYPYQYIRIDDNDDPDIAVFSRYPLRLLEPVGPDLPGARLEVAAPGGPFVLYALHVPRPWLRGEVEGSYQATVPEHRRLVEQVAARMRAEILPVVLVGDLNSTDRGRDYRLLLSSGLVDAMRDTTGAPTSIGKWTPLLARIDHVLVSAGWCGDLARRLDLPGSSHHGVTATVGRCGEVR